MRGSVRARAIPRPFAGGKWGQSGEFLEALLLEAKPLRMNFPRHRHLGKFIGGWGAILPCRPDHRFSRA